MFNKAVSYSLITKVISFISGPVNAFLISSFFTEQAQGFYYTFFSLLTIQVFIELGLANVTQHFSSHEWINLRYSNKIIVGTKNSLERLSEIFKFSFNWFLIGSIIFTFLIILFGFYFFSLSDNSNLINWKYPWICLCIITGFNILFAPIISVLEGCNRVNDVYLYRLLTAIVVFLVTVISILNDFELWTAVMIVLSNFLCSFFFILLFYRNFFKQLLKTKSIKKFNWKKEMLPMQYKIAISWIAGYLTFNLYTPLIFNFIGPEEAGKFGMTWSILSSLLAISSAFLMPKIPQMSMYVAEKEFQKLKVYFSKLFNNVFMVSVLSCLLIYCGLFYIIDLVDLNFLNNFSNRILKHNEFIILIIGQFFLMVGSPFSAYMRSFKKEPLMLLSLISGFSSIVFVYISAKYFNIQAVCLVYLLVNLICYPFIILIYKNFKIKHINV